MATVYVADNYTNQQRTVPDAADFTQVFSFTIPAAGFIINDTVKLCHIPGVACAAGVTLLDWYLDVPALDSGTTVRISLGDAGTAGKFFAIALAGGSSAGSVISSGVTDSVAGSLPASYTTEDNFILKITTAAAATTTSGTFKGYCRFNAIGIGTLT